MLDLLHGVILVEHLGGVTGPHLSPTVLAHVVHYKLDLQIIN